MEGTNLFTFSGNNVWFWGYDSSIGQANGVTSGTKAIYTYNGNYPNNMPTTYWATSPVMNCGGCSGGWYLKFQKRLGVESSTWDRAYVSSRIRQGTGSTFGQIQVQSTMANTRLKPSPFQITLLKLKLPSSFLVLEQRTAAYNTPDGILTMLKFYRKHRAFRRVKGIGPQHRLVQVQRLEVSHLPMDC